MSVDVLAAGRLAGADRMERAERDAASCLARALARLQSLQHPDGRFQGEVVWCPIILAQYVILRAIIERPIAEAERARMVRHFERTRRSEGGWGLHAEAPPYVFVTTLSYVALRLLGVPPEAPLTADARRWLHAQPGGVLGIPSWGKFWLAMLGLYDYAGMNPCPPEIFLLPPRSPVHPDQLYCHTRAIYLVMSCLYGMRFRRDLGPIAAALRAELYREPYGSIAFKAHRNRIAATDLYVAPGRALRAAWAAMAAYERLVPKVAALQALRRRAIEHGLARIRFEQRASNFEGLSPVNGILDAIALFANDPHDPMIDRLLAGIDSWRWDDAEDGIRFAGTQTASWDTAFAVLAVLAGPAGSRSLVQRAYAYLDAAQEQDELDAAPARDVIRGGWCVGDGRHRWPVSDCAAEALSALLAAHDERLPEAANRVADERLEAAVRFILSRRNADGGFGSYERRRGPRFLERLNPSEMFGDCMTELSYVECTASAVIALCGFRDRHPQAMRSEVDGAVAEGCTLLRARQREDGSWPGFWGINFTYATWFAVSALRAAGAERDDPALMRAAQWLTAKQKPDGGWGEHYSGCLTATYVEHPESQPTMTSWALLALLETVGAEADAVRCGVAWLCRAQRPDGSWPEGAVNGVFFGSAMLVYRLYPMIFPLWTLNRYCAASSDVSHA